jgi:hypothetical protein
VVRENENAGHLDLLGVSCLMLTRAAVATTLPERRRLAPIVKVLGEALADLARNPGDRATRQGAADRALEVARQLPTGGRSQDSFLGAAVMAAGIVAVDVMTFAGVDPEQAVAAVAEGTGEFQVPAPPATPRTPFG